MIRADAASNLSRIAELEAENAKLRAECDMNEYKIRNMALIISGIRDQNTKLRALVKRASKSTSYDDCDCLSVTGRLCFPCECKEALK